MTTHARGTLAVRPRLESLDERVVLTASFDPNRVLVTLADASTTSPAVANLRTSPVVDSVTPLGLGIYSVDVKDGVSVAAAVTALAAAPGVTGASPDYTITGTAVPSDSRVGEQWHYRGPSNGVGGINAYAGWNAAAGTRNTVVAVLDSGVDFRHPDLDANLWRNPGEVAGNGFDDDGNGFIDDMLGVDLSNNDSIPEDQYGHGTHVAGVIGATGNNGFGVTGVAQRTRIMSVKFMGADGSGFTSNAVRGIDYAISEGARVINMSWGGGPYNTALAAAIQRARAAGVIVVASAGNDGINTDSTPVYPGGYVTNSDNMVVVAATNWSDTLTSWSNFGRNTVTLAAPGESILSTTNGGGYGLKSGTSMAAPMVAGALAVLWDQNPSWSYSTVISRLKSTLDPLPSLTATTQTGGRLNLAKLLGANTNPPPVLPPVIPPTVPPVTTGAGPVAASAGFGGPRAGRFDRAYINFDRAVNPATFTAADVRVTAPNGAPLGVSSVVPVAGSGNRSFYLMLARTQTGNGTYRVTVGPDVRDTNGRAMNQNGNGVGGETADVFTATAVIGAASPPVVSPPPASPPTSPPVSPPSADGRRTFAATPGATITDLRTTRIDIPVGQTFNVADLNVMLDVTHGRTWDLSIKLVAPNGTTVTLFNRRGGSGANLTGTWFDDSAHGAVAWGTAPFSGTFRPEQSLAGFNGMNANGTWTLVISDLSAGATGRVNAVTLSFAGATAGNVVNAVGTVPAASLEPAAATPTPSAVAVPVPPVKRAAPTAVVFGPSGSGKVTPATRAPASLILPATPKADPLEV
ncbi:MAG: S8 family serine peptidase [Fimbriiglobus sp.]